MATELPLQVVLIRDIRDKWLWNIVIGEQIAAASNVLYDSGREAFEDAIVLIERNWS